MNRKIIIVAISILGILLLIMGACTANMESCPPCPPCNAVEPVEPKPQTKADLDITDMNHRRDGIGNLIIVGLIENAGSGTARQVEVSCSAFGADGGLVNLHTTYPRQMTIAPGQETSFECYLDETSPVTDYKCVVSWD